MNSSRILCWHFELLTFIWWFFSFKPESSHLPSGICHLKYPKNMHHPFTCLSPTLIILQIFAEKIACKWLAPAFPLQVPVLKMNIRTGKCSHTNEKLLTGKPLQYSCLENSMDRGSWQTIVHGVARVRHYLATKPPPNTCLRKPIFSFLLINCQRISQIILPLCLFTWLASTVNGL